MEQLEILEWAMFGVARKLQETTDANERTELEAKLRQLARLSVREELK